MSTTDTDLSQIFNLNYIQPHVFSVPEKMQRAKKDKENAPPPLHPAFIRFEGPLSKDCNSEFVVRYSNFSLPLLVTFFKNDADA